MRKKKSGMSSAYGFILSDIIIVVFILCCMIPYISHSMRIAREKTLDELNGVAERTLNAIDYAIDSTRDMLMNNGSSDIAYLFAMNQNEIGSASYHMNQAAKYIRALSSGQPNVIDIVMYFPRSEIYVQSHGSFDSMRSFDRYYYSDGFSDLLFADISTPYFTPKFKLKTNEIDSINTIGYSFATRNSKCCNVCVLLNIDQILSDVHDLITDMSGSYKLTDAKGVVLASEGDGSGDDLCSTIYGTTFGLEITLPKVQTASTITGLYISLMSAFVLSLISGGALIAINAYRYKRSYVNFHNELMMSMQKADANKRELEVLQGELNASHMREEDFSASIEEYRRLDYSASVAMLFTADALSQDEYRHIVECTGNLYDRYIVAYGTIENKDVHYSEEMWTLLLARLTKQVANNAVIRRYRDQSIIILAPMPQNELQPTLPEPELIHWSQSDVMHSIYDVRTALDQARLRHKEGSSEITFAQLQRIYQYVVSGDAGKASVLLLGIDDEAFTANLDDILMILRLAARQIGISLIPPLAIAGSHVDEQKAKIVAYIEIVCEAMKQHKQSHNDQRKERILEYIRENYSDSSLWAGTIADEVGISEKYLYNFIKEQLGVSLGEYLENIRMEKACELLLTTDIPINEIYPMCGYNSDNTFYKAFKRICGMPPGEYRRKKGNM